MAAQVFARIAKLTGKQLPLALLFRTPTVRQLGEIIGEQGTNITVSCMVPIQTAGRLPAFFCVHGAMGKVLIFRKLALALGFDQPFYAFEAPDVAEEQVGSASVEDMAQNYLRELRPFQPKGPYYLGGLSLGALVASEMARVLSVQGEKVSVILFDPRLPSSASLWRDPRLLAARVAHVMRRLRSEAGTEKLAYLKNIVQNLKGHEQSRRAGYEPEVFWEEDTAQPLPKNVVLLRKSNVLAANRYVPRPFAAKVRLFLSKDESGLKTAVSTSAWRKLALNGVDVRWLPGGHGDYFQDQWVPELASTLKDVLRVCREEQGYRNPD